MIEYLNEDEVYRVGMCIEEAGLEFYTRMAETSDDPQTRRVFKRLASDEREHLALFESMDVKTSGGIGARPADQDQELSTYVCSIVDGGIFKGIRDMANAGRRKMSPRAALELALSVEKDAVLYYTEALHAARRRSAKKALERLVEEEKRHVVEITKRLERLSKTKAAAKKPAGKK